MEMERCAGIDWASEEHALCMVDEGGASVAGEFHSHDDAGIGGLIARMRALGVVRVAIERPDGLLVGLAFLERYPAPEDARGLGEKRLAGFLARNSYCGRRSGAELLERLRSAPQGHAGAMEAEARRGAVLGLVAALKPIVAQIRELTSQIGQAVRSRPDGQVFLPLFKDPKSVVTAARLVAEIGDDRSRYPTREALAADAGMAPVARESGKRKVAGFRWACDKRLRDAVACLADSTRYHHPWARSVYLSARSRGLDHAHAI
jgi:transposase